MSADGVRVAKGYVEIGANLDPLTAKLQVAQSRFLEVGKQLQSAGKGLFTVGAGALGALVPTLLHASDAGEAYNAFQAVMQERTQGAERQLTAMAKTVGRVKSELQETASSFVALADNTEMSREEAAKLAVQATQLSLDLASLKNISDDDAAGKILSALSGEAEPLKRFGVDVSETAVKIRAASQGLQGELSQTQKFMLRWQIIQDSLQRIGAAGDATKTKDSFANQLKAIRAQAVETSQEIGGVLIPVVQRYVPVVQSVLASVSDWVKKNPELVEQLAKIAAGATLGGASLMAIGKGMELASGAVGVLQGGFKLLQPLLAPKDMMEWVNATEKATTVAKLFFGALAVAAVAALAYELSGAREELEKLNDEMERGNRLNDQMDKLRRGQDQQRKPQTVKDMKAAIDEEDKRLQGLLASEKGLSKQIDTAAQKWRDESTAFGWNPFGNDGLDGDRADLKQLNDRIDESRQKAADLRKQLAEKEREQRAASVSMQQAARQQADAVTKATTASRQGYDSVRQSVEATARAEQEAANVSRRAGTAWADRLRVNQDLAQKQAAAAAQRARQPVDDEFVIRGGPVQRKLPGGNFDRWMSSLASVQSSEAARGLAARTVEIRRKEEELLDRIATAGEESRDILKNLPPATIG